MSESQTQLRNDLNVVCVYLRARTCICLCVSVWTSERPLCTSHSFAHNASHVQRVSESETLLRNDFNIVVPRALASTAMDMIEKAETVTADRIVTNTLTHRPHTCYTHPYF